MEHEIEKPAEPEVDDDIRATFKIDDTVFVKRKTLHWPGKVIEVGSKETVIQIFSSGILVRKCVTKYDDVKIFKKDPALTKGRSAAWMASYKEACKHS